MNMDMETHDAMCTGTVGTHSMKNQEIPQHDEKKAFRINSLMNRAHPGLTDEQLKVELVFGQLLSGLNSRASHTMQPEMAQNLKECRRHGTNAVKKKKNAEKSKYEQYEQHDIIDRIKHQ